MGFHPVTVPVSLSIVSRRSLQDRRFRPDFDVFHRLKDVLSVGDKCGYVLSPTKPSESVRNRMFSLLHPAHFLNAQIAPLLRHYQCVDTSSVTTVTPFAIRNSGCRRFQ